MKTLEALVPAELSGSRMDKAVCALFSELSRNAAQMLLADGMVLRNGLRVPKSVAVNEGDRISVLLPDPVPTTASPENIPLEIPYEDSDLLVVNKPKGMVVHPAAGHYEGTLVNALLYHCGDSLSGINGELRPGIVHRIDKDTSGLLIVAKNDIAHRGLAKQIETHSFRREYLTVVVGALKEEEGTIALPLGRSPKDRKKQAVNGLNPRAAVTHFSVLERYNGFTYLRVRLETGRTHQIRVHMAYTGHPVAGDAVYGNPKKTFGLSGQCLHAEMIGFVHPVSGEYLEFHAPLPAYFTDFLRRISHA